MGGVQKFRKTVQVEESYSSYEVRTRDKDQTFCLFDPGICTTLSHGSTNDVDVEFI